MPDRKLITVDKFCDNKQCPDYGRTSKKNIKGFGHSANVTQRYRCKTCGVTFTETKGALLYGRRTPKKDVLEALAMLAERMSIAAVARVKGVKEETVSDWLKEAVNHIQEIEEELLREHYALASNILDIFVNPDVRKIAWDSGAPNGLFVSTNHKIIGSG
jgi:transposase-like protein